MALISSSLISTEDKDPVAACVGSTEVAAVETVGCDVLACDVAVEPGQYIRVINKYIRTTTKQQLDNGSSRFFIRLQTICSYITSV